VDAGHDVLLYGTRFPVEQIAAYCARGLSAGDQAVLAIGTTDHLAVLRAALSETSIDVTSAEARGQLLLLAAEGTVAALHVSGEWNHAAFDAVVGVRVREVLVRFPKVRAFGEIVDLLCRSGRADTAIELEGAWNWLRHDHRFELLCAYSLEGLERASASGHGVHVCAAHAEVRLATA
jgi:hypothetical protein